MARKKDVTQSALPTKEQILDFVRKSPVLVGKREIARAFAITGGQRIELKRLLAELKEDGLIGRPQARKLVAKGSLPAVGVVEINDQDADGELWGRLVSGRRDGEEDEDGKRGAGLRDLAILIVPGDRSSGPPPGLGDRVLAHLAQPEGEPAQARVIRRLGQSANRLLGVFRSHGPGGDGEVQPVDKKAKFSLVIGREDTMGARNGELVLAEPLAERRYGPKRGRIRERLGPVDQPDKVSLIAIHAHGIRMEFPDAVVREAEEAKPVTALGKRTDLRDLPFITIDPADARDHDDAVYAEADSDPQNPGGMIIWVAIADVAHYVTPGSALDREALARGNSTYFPDRVVPMLPEKLSADLCSLMANVPRPVLAVRMVFGPDGKKKTHKFYRALIKVAAGISYEQAQAAADGRPDEETAPFVDGVIKPLYAAYRMLSQARDKRGPLDLDLPERKIELGPDGRIRAIKFRERFDSHKLIEEMMIAANVAAAETLEAQRTPCMYRVHEEPTSEKIDALRSFLQTLNIPFAKGQVLRPALFNGVLTAAKDTAHREVVNEIVLRSQTQAYYKPDNMGHFGLALTRYAHFTSPIRRYADLLVHRGLIRGLKLGDGGLREEDIPRFHDMGEDISALERRSMAAERDSTDRYIAAFMSDRVGARFTARISGVTRFGLFVALTETGADGLIPISTLGRDFFRHDERKHALIGERTGQVFRLGDRIPVRLLEATPLTGGLRFGLALENEDEDAPAGQDAPARARNGRPPRPEKPAKRGPPSKRRRR